MGRSAPGRRPKAGVGSADPAPEPRELPPSVSLSRHAPRPGGRSLPKEREVGQGFPALTREGERAWFVPRGSLLPAVQPCPLHRRGRGTRGVGVRDEVPGRTPGARGERGVRSEGAGSRRPVPRPDPSQPSSGPQDTGVRTTERQEAQLGWCAEEPLPGSVLFFLRVRRMEAGRERNRVSRRPDADVCGDVSYLAPRHRVAPTRTHRRLRGPPGASADPHPDAGGTRTIEFRDSAGPLCDAPLYLMPPGRFCPGAADSSKMGESVG